MCIRDRLYIGRLLAALSSTATVGLTMVLAGRLYHQPADGAAGRRAARWSGLLLAICLLPVREAHFGTVDSLLVALMMLALLLGERLARRGAWRDYALTGAAVALAMAVKIGAGLLVVPVLVAHLAQTRRQLNRPASWGVPQLLVCGLVVVGLWLVLNPYALLNPATYFDLDRNDSVRTQSLVVAGSLRVLYTAQFEGTPRFLYALTNWLRYGLGLPLTGLSLAAVGGGLWRLWQARRGRPTWEPQQGIAATESGRLPAWFADAYVLAWLLAYFVVAGGAYAKFIRYALPLAPPLCILGGRLLADLWTGWRPGAPRLGWQTMGGRILALIVVGAGLLHTLAMSLIHLSGPTSPY